MYRLRSEYFCVFTINNNYILLNKTQPEDDSMSVKTLN
jgi:hypothetical protein